MITITVKYRPAAFADGEGYIYYKVALGKKVRSIATDIRIFHDEWNDKKSSIVPGLKSKRSEYLHRARMYIRRDIERIERIERYLDTVTVAHDVEDVLTEYNRYIREYSVFAYMERLMLLLRMNGKYRTAENYKAALNSFRRFRDGKDIMLDYIDSELIESYEAYLQRRGIVANTISFYMRIMRAVYNKAVEEGITDSRIPFRRVYTGIDKTIKRALPISIIKKLKNLDLSDLPSYEFARDMFMMSFYLRGMSFIDLAFLKKSDLRNGYLSYRRRKTGKCLVIKWTDEMQSIVDRYPNVNTHYLLNIIKSKSVNEICAYRNVAYNINHNLKRIAHLIGAEIPLTMYVARHSWASAAKSKGIPISVISEGMGHDSELTTQIYLSSLDASLVDRANSVILSSL